MHDPPKATFGKVFLFAPAPGRCPVCAAEHPPDLPHNPASLYYQYQFYRRNGRWPTWHDAMNHCSDAVKQALTYALGVHGIDTGAPNREK